MEDPSTRLLYYYLEAIEAELIIVSLIKLRSIKVLG